MEYAKVLKWGEPRPGNTVDSAVPLGLVNESPWRRRLAQVSRVEPQVIADRMAATTKGDVQGHPFYGNQHEPMRARDMTFSQWMFRANLA